MQTIRKKLTYFILIARKLVPLIIAQIKLARADKALFFKAIEQQMILISKRMGKGMGKSMDKHPEVLEAFARCVKHRVRHIRNTENLRAYLRLIQPMRSSSMELVRIGSGSSEGYRGEFYGDGGYCMLTPPPPTRI